MEFWVASLRSVALTLTVALGSLTAYAVAQDVVFRQESIALANPSVPPASVFSSSPDDVNESRTKAWDNFDLSSETQLSALSWRGLYNSEFNPNAVFRGEIDFLIEVFADDPNPVLQRPQLETPLYSAIVEGGLAGEVANSQVTKVIVPDVSSPPDTEHGQGSGIVLDYQVDLDPFTLAAGEYWLSIQALQTLPSPLDEADPNYYLDPLWAWVFAAAGDKLFYTFDEFEDDFQPGISFPFDTTFTWFGGDPPPDLVGDFNANSELDAGDLDLLSAEIRSSGQDLFFDLNADGEIDLDDHAYWIDDVVGTLRGDADLSLNVDFADFLALSNGFGKAGGWADGDFDGSGLVDFSDFLALSNTFGQGVPPAAATIPEPTSLATGLVGAWLCLIGRRRRSSTRVR